MYGDTIPSRTALKKFVYPRIVDTREEGKRFENGTSKDPLVATDGQVPYSRVEVFKERDEGGKGKVLGSFWVRNSSFQRKATYFMVLII